MDFKKLFYISQWDVAYRDTTSESIEDIISNGRRPTYKQIKDTRDYSFADPLFFEDEQGGFLFVEAINKKTRKGALGVFDFSNGLGEYHPIIEENFHLSYPLVFKKDGQYFLIPESNNAHKLLLYRATEYPYKWELFKVLLDNVDCVDTTVLHKEGDSDLFLFSYFKAEPYNKLTIFSMNDQFELTVEKEIEDKNLALRGAGNFVKIGGNMYRPSQHCKNDYGLFVIFNLVKNYPVYTESPSFRLTPSNVIIDGFKDSSVYKVHTYSHGVDYEFIDFMHRRFSLFKPVKKLCKKIIQ